MLPNSIEPQARAASAAGAPFVVQAIQEDQHAYLARATAFSKGLAHYTIRGQEPGTLRTCLGIYEEEAGGPSELAGFAARTGRAQLCNSEDEAGYVRKLYPAAHCVVNPYGVTSDPASAGPEAFGKAFGLKDFILCVGRLEVRKNQLALLAALEDEDVPLVFVDGGVSFSPEYAEYCRKFRRRGPTVFTGRLEPAMLASCYCAARAHVLPSWQELPGLVTLEAAMHGCNVAATPHGGIREYLGADCHYFEPDDLTAIRRVALQAYAAPKDGAAGKVARRFTWQASVERLLAVYRTVLGQAEGEHGRGGITAAKPAQRTPG
jgi:glycosyltransferase involved in cell wall biosynthesis